ncbi:MAG: S41 family peptidase, partial [Cyclobacteriaceae bacterium]
YKYSSYQPISREIEALCSRASVNEMMIDVATEIFKSYGFFKKHEVVIKNLFGKVDTLHLEATSPLGFVDRIRKPAFEHDETKSMMIEGGIIYVNLDIIQADDFFDLLATMENAESIVLDMRGYPDIGVRDIYKLIGYFIDKGDSTKWFHTPNILYPDRKDYMQLVTSTGWKVDRSFPHLKTKIYMLIDEQAQSYAESVIAHFARMPQVTLIGSPTSGVNGNVNRFLLPGGYFSCILEFEQ